MARKDEEFLKYVTYPFHPLNERPRGWLRWVFLPGSIHPKFQLIYFVSIFIIIDATAPFGKVPKVWFSIEYPVHLNWFQGTFWLL